jgi:predicted nucleic acid-binding protein
MPSIAIVDTGPLYALVDADDAEHDRCRAVLERSDLQLVVPSLVVAEACYLIGTRLGAREEAALVRGLADLEVETPVGDDWPRIADLIERYADWPLGATDACVLALAERLNAPIVVTLDRRHFGALRPRHIAALTLLP